MARGGPQQQIPRFAQHGMDAAPVAPFSVDDHPVTASTM